MAKSGRHETGRRESRSLLGQSIAGLEIRELLGEGGMAQVYLGHQAALGVTRAVKVIHSHEHDDQISRARFRREARVLGQLHHHHIVEVIDFGELDSGELFFVMEYIEGADLGALVSSTRPLSLASGLRVLRDVTDAVAHAHSLGVVHRDLKPANIVARNGDTAQTKVIDFGLVRFLSEGQITKLTEVDHVLGSPQYMSPEQAQARSDLTAAVDVYALAGLTYFLLSGSPVFPYQEFSTVVDVLRAHSNATPEPLSGRVDTPESLDDILQACLAKNPVHRPSAEELGRHFERLYLAEQSKQLGGDNEVSSRIVVAATSDSNEFEESLASTIWGQQAGPDERAANVRRLEAIQRKAEQALLVLGDEVASEPGCKGLVDKLEQVRNSQHRLESLELEGALLEPAAGGDGDDGGSERDSIRNQVTNMEDTIRAEFRELYLEVMKHAPESGSERAASFVSAIRTLIESYRDIAEPE